MTIPASDKQMRPLYLLFFVVMLNYLSQIPYDLHLYGLNWNPRGVALLGATLAWFLVGFGLLVRRLPIGYWLTLAFVALQLLFYFNNEIVLAFYGYGMPYHVTTLKDPVIWAVEMAGILNFFAAIFFLFYLLRRRSSLLDNRLSSRSMASAR